MSSEIYIERVPMEDCPLCFTANTYRRVYVASVPVQGVVPRQQQISLDVCEGCDLAWQNPMPTKASLSKYYEFAPVTSGAAMAAGAPVPGQQVARLAYRFQFFLAATRVFSPESALDFGAGNEVLLSVLSSQLQSADFFQGFAVDSSKTAALRLESLGITCWDSIWDVPKHHRFDLITAFSVLEHVVDPIETLRGLSGLLDSEGEIWLVVPNSLFPRLSAGEFYGFEHLWHYTSRSLRLLLERSGLACVTIGELKDGSLLAIAKKCAEPTLTAAMPDTVLRSRLVSAFRAYETERTKLRGRVRLAVDNFVTACRKNNDMNQSYIWGIGQHTDQLFEQFPDLNATHGYIDSSISPGTVVQYRGRTAHSPEDVPWLQVACVFVSSEAALLDIVADCKRRMRPSCVVISPYVRSDLTLPPSD